MIFFLHKKYLYLTLAGVWLFCIAYTSSLPASAFPILPLWMPYAVHFTEYFILSFFVFKFFFHSGYAGVKPYIFTFFCLGTLAGIDEMHQRWIQGRVPSFLDFCTDLGGIMSMLFIVKLVDKVREIYYRRGVQ